MVAYLVLSWGVFRPVLAILAKRQQLTIETKDRSSSLEVETDQLLAACEHKMRDARHLGVREKEDRRQEAEKVQVELLKKIRLETSRKVEEVRGVLEKQVRDASLQLRQYTQGVGQEIVAKILNSE